MGQKPASCEILAGRPGGGPCHSSPFAAAAKFFLLSCVECVYPATYKATLRSESPDLQAFRRSWEATNFWEKFEHDDNR